MTHEYGNDEGGFLGGPFETSLLTTYANHVAHVIWEGQISKVFTIFFLFHALCKIFYAILSHAKCFLGSSYEIGLRFKKVRSLDDIMCLFILK